MTLRQKMLLMLALTVMGVVAAVGWTGSVRVGHVFEDMDRQQTDLLVGQFQHEFNQRASETAAAVDRMAASDTLRRIAFDLSNGGDSAPYLTVAVPLAEEYRLDYLELIGHDGSIVSSLQWTARFGYKEPAVTAAGKPAFLKQEDLPDGTSQVGLFAVRTVTGSDPPLYVVGGRQLDAGFLRDFSVPAGTQIFIYKNVSGPFDAHNFAGPLQGPDSGEHYEALVDDARSNARNAEGVVYPTSRSEDSMSVTAIPLKGLEGDVLAVLVVANSRRSMVEVQRHIRDIAYGIAGLGIIFAVLASLWIAARISRPIEELARAAGRVAEGDWETRVDIRTMDEVGALARSFNNMTRQLAEQRERLVQTERVAAWRELARRLAHELKNPLFPLQITVENMQRARASYPEQFDEVFAEGTSTLLAELSNLKQIIGRFSDFAKMPAPEMQPVNFNQLVPETLRLFEAQLAKAGIRASAQLDPALRPVEADAEQMTRVLRNLILNAVDAMPEGGTLTVRTIALGAGARLEVSDTGQGLTPEECERLFTPYYTTKTHGTGLGLAIVQSVVSDHKGRIAVESEKGKGTTFRIDLG